MNLLKQYEQEKEKYDDLEKDLPEDEKFDVEKVNDADEQMLDEENKDVTKTYKLFNYVATQQIHQILRYISPSKGYTKYGPIEPLWIS